MGLSESHQSECAGEIQRLWRKMTPDRRTICNPSPPTSEPFQVGAFKIWRLRDHGDLTFMAILKVITRVCELAEGSIEPSIILKPIGRDTHTSWRCESGLEFGLIMELSILLDPKTGPNLFAITRDLEPR